MEWKKVVCAVDLAEGGDETLAQADRLARGAGARLAVVHVLPSGYPGAPMFPYLVQQNLVRHERLASEAISAVLGRLTALTGRRPEDVDVIVEDGAPDAAVINRAEELGADLLAIPAEGRGPLLGGVTVKLLRHAHCSVLVSRPGPRSGVILAATDFSPPAVLALKAAAAEARRHNARLVACHAIELIKPGIGLGEPAALPGSGPVFPPLDELRPAAQRHLANEVRELGVAADVRIVEEAPALSIPKLAAELGAELVVVGTAGLTGLKRMLLGSVAEQVAKNAPCSVLVVRPYVPAR